MPAQLATLLFTVFIIWIFRQDFRWNRGSSPALWLPFIWMGIQGSRSVKEWLYGFVTIGGANTADLVGSSADRILILILLILGLAILSKRAFSWNSMVVRHTALALFFIFGIASVAWSETRSSSILQWHRMLLSLVMVLVVFTDREPEKALNVVMGRIGYLLIPLSVLFVKYLPERGRVYSQWGLGQIVGVSNNKNSLGLLCMVVGIYFTYSLLAGSRRKGVASRRERQIAFLILGMTCWLLYRSETSNAFVAGLVGAVVLFMLQRPLIRRNFTAVLIVCTITGAIILAVPGVFELIMGGLGEDTTITGRTDLWADLLTVEINPLIGVGFESFWLGPRKDFLWQKYWWRPNEAHNAYIEMYLNLGYLGLALLLAMIVSCYRKSRHQMLSETATGKASGHPTIEPLARLRMAYLVSLLFYGYAEAVFRPSSFGFLVFLLAAVEYLPQERVQEVISKWRSRHKAAIPARPYRYSG